MGIIKRNKGSALERLRKQKEIQKKVDAGIARRPKGSAQELLMVALDASGSMASLADPTSRTAMTVYQRREPYGRDSKWWAAKQATIELVGLSYRSRVGVLMFSTGVGGSVRIGSTQAEVQGWLVQQRPGGGTNFAAALSGSIIALIAEPHTGEVRRIILMSDGRDGGHVAAGEGDREYQIRRCIKHEILVDTVGFGDADEETLKMIAERTGGVYRHARDGVSLVREFKQLEAGARGLLGSGS